MTRESLIKKTIANLNKLPDKKLKDVSDYAELLLSKLENKLLTEGFQQLNAKSDTFKFLEDEEDLYTVEDVKEKYQ